MAVTIGLPSSMPAVPYGEIKAGYSLFEIIFKISYMMYKQVFVAQSPQKARELGEEFCKVYGFQYITVNPFIIDIEDAIAKKKKLIELQGQEDVKVEKVEVKK